MYVTLFLKSFFMCTGVGSDVNEADVDLEVIEIKSKGDIVSDEACFSDEIDEISSEIQELTAKGSCEVNTFI